MNWSMLNPQNWWKDFNNIFSTPAVPKLHPLLKKTERWLEFDTEDWEELDREDVRIMTLNLFMRPPGIKNNENDYKEERFDEYLKLLNNYDIICNQEIFNCLNSRKERLVAHAKKLGFIYEAIPAQPKLLQHYCIDSGLWILSRFPILKQAEMSFSRYAYSDAMSNKGALYARIKIGNSTLHLFNTHLQANYLHSDFTTYSYSINYRICHQVIELINFIDEQTMDMSQNDKIMIWGDFNISSLPFSQSTRNSLKELAKRYPKYSDLLEDDYDSLGEYKILLKLLSKEGRFTVQNLKSGDEENTLSDPITFGDFVVNQDGTKSPAEVALTHESDSMVGTSIDYIFQLDRNEFEDDQQQDSSKTKLIKNTQMAKSDDTEAEELEVIKESLKQEKFLVQNREFTQLSDHYGLSVSVNLKKQGLKK